MLSYVHKQRQTHRRNNRITRTTTAVGKDGLAVINVDVYAYVFYHRQRIYYRTSVYDAGTFC